MTQLMKYLKLGLIILIIAYIAPPIIIQLKNYYTDLIETKTKVGYVSFMGTIDDSDGYNNTLKKLFKDPDIKAILIKMESPGSAAGTGEAIANEIELLKKEYPKPIITLCENSCTSGSYYIAATTDYIIAPPSALIGGVGTRIANIFKIKDLLDQFHITYLDIKSGSYKDATNPFAGLTQDQQALLQGLTDDSYQNFIEHVVRQRHQLNIKSADEWANGKLFTGRQAKMIGLIDELGSLTNAIEKIKKLAIIEGDIVWIKPREKTNMWDFLPSFGITQEASKSVWLIAFIINSLLNPKQITQDVSA